MTWGLTSTGFTRKTLADCLTELEEQYRTIFGADADLTGNTPEGELLGIHAEREAELWELAEAVYLSAFPASASGVPLAQAVTLTGHEKLDSQYSTVTATLTGTGATVVPAGFQAKVTSTGVVFALAAAATITGGGTLQFSALPAAGHTIAVTVNGTTVTVAYATSGAATMTDLAAQLQALAAVQTAAVDAQVGTRINVTAITGGALIMTGGVAGAGAPTLTIDDDLGTVQGSLVAQLPGVNAVSAASQWTIVTPVSGLVSVTNVASAVPGRDEETDAALRSRRAQNLVIALGGTATAMENAIGLVAGVTFVGVRENRTDAVDADGLPAHSVHVDVLGGTDAAVAAAVWASKPAGAAMHGSTSVTITDTEEREQVVKFSRGVDVPIYLAVTVTPTAEYPADGADRVKQALLVYFQGLDYGDDVLNWRLVAALAEIAGIQDVVVLQGTQLLQMETDNIVVSGNQHATLTADNILVS